MAHRKNKLKIIKQEIRSTKKREAEAVVDRRTRTKIN